MLKRASSDLAVEEVDDYVKDVSQNLDSEPLDEAMEACRDELYRGIRSAFNSSVDPETGVSWAPRKREGDGHPLLIDTGALLQSAVGSGPGMIQRLDAREVTIGSSVYYGKFHQYGTNKMPARPFMGASPETLDRCGEIIADAALELF